MGVALSSAFTLLALFAAASATAALEPRLLRRDRGPASPIVPRIDREPPRPDPLLYVLGPIVALLGAAWAMVVIPFAQGFIGADLGIGLFYFLVVIDFLVLGVAMGGYGADTPSSVESCYRVVAQLVAYVVPVGLAVLGPIMMARSLSTVDIVMAQKNAGFPYILVQPLGFLLYLVTGLMQAYRPPFVEPFAEPIAFGVIGAYGGWKGLLWRAALSGLFFLIAAMGAVLFLGGFAGPLLPGPLWMLLKTLLLGALMLFLGNRTRRRSTAEMLALSWKVLIPIGLVNVAFVGALILLGVGQAPFGE